MPLKIKDSVDLNELKKFGFTTHRFDIWEYSTDYIIILVNYIGQTIDRELAIYCPEPEDYWGDQAYDLDIVWDLIQAGLVEKV